MNKQPLKLNQSLVEDSPFQDVDNEGHVNISLKGDSSLGAPLQDNLNEENINSLMELETSTHDPPLPSEQQATPPVLVSLQLLEEGTKRGHNKQFRLYL